MGTALGVPHRQPRVWLIQSRLRPRQSSKRPRHPSQRQIRLIIEVDGEYHGKRQRYDARRDAKLRDLGYRVVRLTAALVMQDLSAAICVVRAAL